MQVGRREPSTDTTAIIDLVVEKCVRKQDEQSKEKACKTEACTKGKHILRQNARSILLKLS